MTTSTMVDLIVMGLATLTGILFGIGVGTVFERRRAHGVREAAIVQCPGCGEGVAEGMPCRRKRGHVRPPDCKASQPREGDPDAYGVALPASSVQPKPVNEDANDAALFLLHQAGMRPDGTFPDGVIAAPKNQQEN